MKSRPLPISVVAILLIVVGAIGFAYHIKDLFEPRDALHEIVLVQLLRVIAIISGALLLRRIRVGRWLSIVWILAHIAISTLHSVPETIAHIVLLVVVSILLFMPTSSAYFQQAERYESSPPRSPH